MSILNHQLALELYIYKYFPNIKILFYLSIILEFLQIFSSIVINTNFVDFENNPNTVNDDFKKKYMQYLGVNNLIRNNFICKKNLLYIKSGIQKVIDTNNFLKFCAYENFYFYFVFVFLVSLIIIFIIILYFGINNKKSENLEILENFKNGRKIDFLKKLFFYFPDIVFHIFGQSFIDIILNSILSSFIESDSLKTFDINFLVFLLSFVCLIVFLILYYKYVKIFFIYVNFSYSVNFPYDAEFSKKYDCLLLIIKFFISLQENLIRVGTSNKNLFKFFNLISLILFVLFLYFLLHKILFKDHLFLVNQNLNNLRIFFIGLVNLIYLTIYVFQFSNEFSIISVVNILFIIIAALLFSYWIDYSNYNNIILGDNIISQLTIILVEKFSLCNEDNNRNIKNKNNENFDFQSFIKANLFINKIIFSHNMNCKQENCEIASLNEPNIDFFLTVYLNEICKNNNHKSDEKDIILKNILMAIVTNITYTEKSEKLIRMHFISKKFRLIHKETKLLAVLNFINEENKVLHKKKFINYELIKLFTEVFTDYSNCIQIINETCSFLNSQNYKEVFKRSRLIKEICKKIKANFININKNKDIYVDNYSFYFLKFLFKKIFNKKLFVENEYVIPNGFYFQIENIYNNENFLIINFNQNELIIKKGSKLYSQLVNKNFESLFPDILKNIYHKNFIKLIENSKGEDFSTKLIFRTPIIDYDPFENENLLNKKNSLKISAEISKSLTSNSLKGKNLKKDENCEKNNIIIDFDLNLVLVNSKTFPSLNLKEIAIVLKCQFLKEELMIFNANLLNGINNLVIFSKNLEKNLCIPNNILKYLLNFNIMFDDIYTIKELEQIIEDKTKEEENVKKNTLYFFDYEKYSKIFFRITKYLFEQDKIDNDTINYFIINFKRDKKKIRDQASNLYDIKIYEELNSEVVNDITIYEIKKIKNGRHLRNENKSDNEDNINHDYNENKSMIRDGKIEDLDFDFDTNSVSMDSNKLSSKKSKKKFLNLNVSEKNIESQEKNNKYIHNFIKLLIFVVLGLCIFSLIIMILAISTINEIKSLFNLNNNFNKLISSYYDSMMNLHQNILTFQFNSTNPDFNNGYDFFARYYKQGVIMNVNDYLNRETIKKVDEIKTTILEVKNIFFSVGYDYIIQEFFQKKMKIYYVTNSQNLINISSKESDFFNALDLFLSTGKIIAENPNVLTYIYYIDTSENFFNFKNFYIKNLDVYQINSINLIINFDSFAPRMDYYKIVLNKLFFERIDYMYLIILITFLVFNFIHLFMIWILLMILNFFKVKLYYNILIIEDFLGKDGVADLFYKLNLLKKLTHLYIENPILTLNELNKQKEEKKKKQGIQNGINNTKSYNNYYEKKDKINNENELIQLVHNKNDKMKSKKIYLMLKNSGIFTQFYKFTFIIFGFYFIYNGIFFYIYQIFHNQNISYNKFAQINWKISQDIVKNSVSFNTILLLNQTNDYLTKTYSQTSSLEFIYDNNLTEYYENLNSLMKSAKQNLHVNQLTQYYYDFIDCNTIYQSYNDPLISKINKMLPKSDVINGLTIICKNFPILKEKDYFKLYEETNYILRSINHQLQDGPKSYDKIRNIYFGDNIFALFIGILFILRPIRVYIENNLLNILIEASIGNYILSVIIYLIFNYIIDFIFIYLIKKKIVNKVLEIDENVINLMDCLVIN